MPVISTHQLQPRQACETSKDSRREARELIAGLRGEVGFAGERASGWIAGLTRDMARQGTR